MQLRMKQFSNESNRDTNAEHFWSMICLDVKQVFLCFFISLLSISFIFPFLLRCWNLEQWTFRSYQCVDSSRKSLIICLSIKDDKKKNIYIIMNCVVFFFVESDHTSFFRKLLNRRMFNVLIILMNNNNKVW